LPFFYAGLYKERLYIYIYVYIFFKRDYIFFAVSGKKKEELDWPCGERRGVEEDYGGEDERKKRERETERGSDK